ncbi:MAG: ATP-dependent DNA helicase RecG, partial [Chlorobi bacterium]|nr:ATP-dependent DNA helicase RecG [Chlorobiota bacterium]
MSSASFWQTPVKYLKGVGPSRADLLESELGIRTFADLLHFFPYKYVDRSRIYKIAELDFAPAEVQLKGQFVEFREVEGAKGKRLIGIFRDDTGELEAVWFKNYKWVPRTYRIGEEYILSGKINRFGYQVSMPHPEVDKPETADGVHSGGLIPLYPATEKLVKKGLTKRVMRRIMAELFARGRNYIEETLPRGVLEAHRLMPRREALQHIHFPSSLEELSAARRRLKFEELFFLQLQLLQKRFQHRREVPGIILEKIGEY